MAMTLKGLLESDQFTQDEKEIVMTLLDHGGSFYNAMLHVVLVANQVETEMLGLGLPSLVAAIVAYKEGLLTERAAAYGVTLPGVDVVMRGRTT